MPETEIRKRKPGGGRKPNPIPTKAVRLPLPLAQKLLDLKENQSLEAGHLEELFFEQRN